MRCLSAMWIISLFLSASALVAWAWTGSDWYTKFQVVELREVAVDPDDPFAATGLYDGDAQTQAEPRDEFRLGLLPSGAGKHLISVATLALPLWLVSAALWLRESGRRRKLNPQSR